MSEETKAVTLTKPCAQCPWRLKNQGKRHFGGFYTKANLRRLWNQVRGGGAQQSCHLTDPQHPDHIASGAKPDSIAAECPGSIIVISRELKKIESLGDGVISVPAISKYHSTRKRGITKKGILYWGVQRIQYAGVPFIGGPKLPEVVDDPEIGLPDELLS